MVRWRAIAGAACVNLAARPPTMAAGSDLRPSFEGLAIARRRTRVNALMARPPQDDVEGVGTPSKRQTFTASQDDVESVGTPPNRQTFTAFQLRATDMNHCSRHD